MMRVMLVFVRLAVQNIVVIKFCCVLVDQCFLLVDCVGGSMDVRMLLFYII